MDVTKNNIAWPVQSVSFKPSVIELHAEVWKKFMNI